MTRRPFSTLSQLSRPVWFATGIALGVVIGANSALAGNIIEIGEGNLGLADEQAATSHWARPITKPTTKLKLGLDTLNIEFQAFQEAVTTGIAVADTFVSKRTAARIVGNQVVIDAIAADAPDVLKTSLEAMGSKVTGVAGRMVSAQLPLDMLPALENLPTLQFARPVWATSKTGSIISQGDEAQSSDLARLNFGVIGVGSTVGVLSDSFDCAPGTGGDYAADILSGDLPTGVNILADMSLGCTDEGRAMAQIVHDVAPGAGLAFHTAFNGEADFAQGILDLAAAGSDIIVDDVQYFAEPMFQDGAIAQAVDQVDAMGIAYFSSAGNNGREAYEAPFTDSGLTGPAGGVLHDFDSGPGVDTRLEITQNANTTYILQWQDPFFSVSGAPGASTDLDICFYSPSGAATPFFCSSDLNTGGDPVEGVGINGTGNLEISIERITGSDPDLVKLVSFGDIAFFEPYAGTNAGSIYGHSNAVGANAIGASAYFLTPAFFEDPPVLNYYSSAGNTPILFDTVGNPILDIREKPEFTAPDGGNNTFFGSDYEHDGWPNFFGTSAAAPHAAAVAALMREVVPALTPAEITTVLQDTAIDILERETLNFGGPRVFIGVGYDNDSGSGLIDAEAAVAALIVTECNLTTFPLTVDFGTVLVGQTTTETVELQNLGNAACNLISLDVTGDEFTLNSTAPMTPFSIDAGMSVSVPVDYTPINIGADIGALTVASDDPDNPAFDIILSGTGDIFSQEADLAITVTDSPDPVVVGSHLTYTITVANEGLGTATGVNMTDILPHRVRFVSVTTSQGSCSGTKTVICNLSSLDAGASAVVEIIVKPIYTIRERIFNRAEVEAIEVDPDLSNNKTFELTQVLNVNP